MATEEANRPIDITMSVKGVSPSDEAAVKQALTEAATKMAHDLSEAATRKDQSFSVTGSTNSQGVSSVGATYTVRW
jgi:hypothetical protein